MSLKPTYFRLFFKNLMDTNENLASQSSTASDQSCEYFTKIFKHDFEDSDRRETLQFKLEQELDKEISCFTDLLLNHNLLKNIKSTCSFWNQNGTNMPH